jgi:hypothetical protein
MRWKILLGLVFIGVMAGSVFLIKSLTKEDTRKDVEFDQVDINRSKWEELKITDYDLIAFFSDSVLTSYQMEVSVRDGEVSTYRVTCLLPENDPCEQDRFDPDMFTVPGLYDLLDEATDWKGNIATREVLIQYNVQYPFPAVLKRWDTEIVDSTFQVTVISFNPLN